MDSEKKTTTDNEDGRQVMAISHLSVNWKQLSIHYPIGLHVKIYIIVVTISDLGI
jgi:hypothetical protein